MSQPVSFMGAIWIIILFLGWSIACLFRNQALNQHYIAIISQLYSQIIPSLDDFPPLIKHGNGNLTI